MVGVKPHVEIGLMEEEKKEEKVPSIPEINMANTWYKSKKKIENYLYSQQQNLDKYL